MQHLSMAYQSHHCSATLLYSACISVSLSLRLSRFLFFCSVSACAPRLPLPLFLSQIYIFVLCTMPLLCISAIAHNILFPRVKLFSTEATSSFFFVLCIFIMPSPLPDNTPNSSSPLAITLSLFFIHGHYAKTLWLLWQLQSSTLFHLSIVSILSLHSTDRYLETLQLL
jgi:hypothetical protein